LKTWIYSVVMMCYLVGCASGGHILTARHFYDVPIGSSTQEVVSSLGEPYSVHSKKDGTVEYEYIERVTMGNRVLEQKIYILVFKDGVVVSKKVKPSSDLPYGFDSYDMQTTQQNPDF
jgi:outer membrane protein assembly factor BamE (lipoprotein component of BamABCDE complex)